MADKPPSSSAPSLPPFAITTSYRQTLPPNPTWRPPQGANELQPSNPPPHRSIDPYAPGRPSGSNYRLLISAIIPRPIALLSTRSADGSTTNLAPFSYFGLMSHDPPLFTLGLACSLENPKDSLRNLLDTRECVVNIISESYVEAANATAVNAPYGVSEWSFAGLHPVYDCVDVKCARVGEAVFSVEAKVESFREIKSKVNPGRATVIVVLEGSRFWVREDAVDEAATAIDPAVLRPVGRLGGVSYGRLTDAFEIPRHDFQADFGGYETYQRCREEIEARHDKSKSEAVKHD